MQDAVVKSQGLHLGALLILPIQRIPRYVLLLQDLLRHTESGHPDHADLVQALKDMRQVADYINEKKREAEALNLVVRIQERIHNLVQYHSPSCPASCMRAHREYLPTTQPTPLSMPHRRFMRRGFLSEIEEGHKKKRLR